MLIKISTSLGLLLGFSFLKAFILFILSIDLFNKWKRQKKKYWSDFPFLMSIFFLIYGLSKFYDIYLYYFMKDIYDLPSLLESSIKYGELLVRFRWVMVYFFIAPIVILMLIIWFQNKKKTQIIIYSSWSLFSFAGIFLSSSYNQLLFTSVIISLVPIGISIATYLIMHLKQKMPSINNLLLSISWFLVLFSQLIRPIWQDIGDTAWGATWIAEIIETIPYILIWYGFNHPSNYTKKNSQKERKQINKIEKQIYY